MKKMRNKIIFMLIVIAIVSNTLAHWLSNPLIEEFFADQQTWVGDLLRSSVQYSLMLAIFTLFVIIGVREVTTPVMRLSATAKRIADGDYSVEIPPTRRKDELGVLEESFAVMVKELRSTEYMQKDFVSNVSHEYKTPLAVIAGYAGLLAKGGLSDQARRQYCDLIIDETTRLSRMTSNVLLLSKLEHLGIQPRMEAFSLDEQLRQAALLFIGRMQEKEIALSIDIPDITIHGNAELLMHVWTNLLENAVKFTPHGGCIRVEAHESGGSVAVSIADSGVGMDEETMARMFDQFYQGDPSRQDVGNGLGLTLARRIIELHHGRLSVASTPQEGSTFSALLPASEEAL